MAGEFYAPMGVLALLTFLVLLQIPIRRFAAVRAGRIGPNDFKLGESANVPPETAIPDRNYMNLLELPLLFYVVCLMFEQSGRGSSLALGLAWLYVGLRVVHSVIHLTSNNVIHRLTVFALSNFVLGTLWVVFFVGAS